MSVGNSARLLVLVYSGMFLALVFAVAWEGFATKHWTSNLGHSSVLMLFMMSGWFDKLAGIFNGIVGIGGGVLAVTSAKVPYTGGRLSFAIFAVLILISVGCLGDIFALAYWSPEIAANVVGIHDTGFDAVRAVISALGAIGLSIVAGFIAGIGLANSPAALPVAPQ